MPSAYAALSALRTHGDDVAAPAEATRARPSLRELEVLIAVIETGKTTAAAHRLGISQPAVSRALLQLETAVGRRLFERGGGRLAPTSDAVALADEAGPIFSILERISTRDWRAQGADSLRIVAPPTVAHRYLNRAVPAFAADHPDTHIHIEVATSSDVVSAVADGQADVGIADMGVRHPGVRAHGLLKTQARVVVRVDDPLAALPVIGVADLAGRPFVALTRRFSARALVERAFEEARVPLDVAVEAATAAIVVQLVAAGLGEGRSVGIVNPFPVALRPEPGIRFVPFVPGIAYEVAFLVSAGRPSEAAMRFMDHARRQSPVAQLAEAGIAAEAIGEPVTTAKPTTPKPTA